MLNYNRTSEQMYLTFYIKPSVIVQYRFHDAWKGINVDEWRCDIPFICLDNGFPLGDRSTCNYLYWSTLKVISIVHDVSF